MTDAALARTVPRPRVPGRPSPAVVFGLVALVYGGFVAALGIGFGADSRTYSAAADGLIASGFDYATAIARSRATYPPVMYVGFATLVALLKLLLGEGWAVGLVALNVAAAAGVAALLAGVARRATGSASAAWGSLGLLLACYDFGVWTRFALSDATFLLLAFGVFALAADRVLRRAGSWVPVLALAAFAALYRPTGVVLIPAAAWALFLARSRPGRVRRAATAGLALAAVAGTLVFAWIMQQPSRWPFSAVTGTVERTAHFYALGEVVSGRPATFHAPPVSVVDHAAISADRFIQFFALTAADFSPLHVLVNAVFFVPAYALALWLLVALLRGRDGLSQGQRDVLLAAMGFVLATAAFHGLLQVDFDWRYRAPVLPHLALLAAGGLAVLRRRAAVPAPAAARDDAAGPAGDPRPAATVR